MSQADRVTLAGAASLFTAWTVSGRLALGCLSGLRCLRGRAASVSGPSGRASPSSWRRRGALGPCPGLAHSCDAPREARKSECGTRLGRPRSYQDQAAAVPRDPLPCPTPLPGSEIDAAAAARGCCCSVRSRCRRAFLNCAWARGSPRCQRTCSPPRPTSLALPWPSPWAFDRIRQRPKSSGGGRICMHGRTSLHSALRQRPRLGRRARGADLPFSGAGLATRPRRLSSRCGQRPSGHGSACLAGMVFCVAS